MTVAGSDSKERSIYIAQLLEENGRSFDSIDHQAFQNACKTAETAKKWDRPNFVGSAATLIQCLNSQCEALMKELSLLRQNQSRSEPQNSASPPKFSSESEESKKASSATHPSSMNGQEQQSNGVGN